jgi:hypothetical protein
VLAQPAPHRCRNKRYRARRWFPLVALVVVLAAGACRRSTLPAALSDQEFWRLIEQLSEPAGSFTLSDNVVSNEPRFPETARWLRPRGGVYIGVGPEQNFSYIVGQRPVLAFIVDIRRENLDLHLLYKALFELSSDRVDFVSRLFSRPRPPGLRTTASVDEIFEQFERVPAAAGQYDSTAALVRERLLTVHKLPLSAADLDWIGRTFRWFHEYGPAIDYYGDRAVDAVRPSYRQLMTARDFSGRHRSFLATEAAFRFVKEMQTRNLIVPVVGDFGGPTALRRVGDYVRAHRNRIDIVYGSNVGVYLSNQQTMAFCHNLATLPATSRTLFIDSNGMRPLSAKLGACPKPE